MVLNTDKKENIFGTVRTVEEDIIYKGLETDTAKVTVNNTKREISVEVNVQNLLGFTPTTAYPGNQGLQDKELAYQAMDLVEVERDRAKEAERLLRVQLNKTNDTLDSVTEQLNLEITSETHRAITAEEELKEVIENLRVESKNDLDILSDNVEKLYEHVDSTDSAIREELDQSNVDLQKQITQLDNKTTESDETLKLSINSLDTKVDNNFSRVQQDILDTSTRFYDVVTNLENTTSEKLAEETEAREIAIEDVSSKLERAVEDLITRSDNLYETKEVVKDKIDQVESSIDTLNTNIVKTIEDLSDHVNTQDTLIFESIDTIKQDYAQKTYVYEKLVEFTKLSKQIVDNIDLVNNKIIINQESKDPVDGVLYLVKDISVDVPDVYREYTTIDGTLTLIGDTSISLDGYATEQWVEDQEYLPRTEAQSIYAPITYVDEKSSALEEYVHETVDAIDLTPYAKKEELPTKLSQFENDSDYATRSDIPDVSSFITEIPEEYVTDDELKAEGYLTRSDVDDILLKLEFIDGGTSASILK